MTAMVWGYLIFMGDEFPRRLCDTLPPLILFYHASLQPTSGKIKQQLQGVGGSTWEFVTRSL